MHCIKHTKFGYRTSESWKESWSHITTKTQILKCSLSLIFGGVLSPKLSLFFQLVPFGAAWSFIILLGSADVVIYVWVAYPSSRRRRSSALLSTATDLLNTDEISWMSVHLVKVSYITTFGWHSVLYLLSQNLRVAPFRFQICSISLSSPVSLSSRSVGYWNLLSCDSVSLIQRLAM